MADVDFSNVTSIAIDGGQVKSLSVDGIEIWSEPIGIDYLCFTAEEANSTIKLSK